MEVVFLNIVLFLFVILVKARYKNAKTGKRREKSDVICLDP